MSKTVQVLDLGQVELVHSDRYNNKANYECVWRTL